MLGSNSTVFFFGGGEYWKFVGSNPCTQFLLTNLSKCWMLVLQIFKLVNLTSVSCLINHVSMRNRFSTSLYENKSHCSGLRDGLASFQNVKNVNPLCHTRRTMAPVTCLWRMWKELCHGSRFKRAGEDATKNPDKWFAYFFFSFWLHFIVPLWSILSS